MRRLNYLACALLLGSTLAAAQSQPAGSTDTNPPASSDQAARTNAPVRDSSDNTGWIGLLGLAGLAGLMRRDRKSFDVNRPYVGDVRKVG